MIPFFSPPYPDELLYSAISRVAAVMDYPHQTSFSRQIFGQHRAKVSVDLASHLDHLLEALPYGHHLTVAQIIDHHTLFPYYQPSLTTAQAQKLKEAMRGPNLAKVYRTLDVFLKRLDPPDHLRYCPNCVIADRKTYGSTYWHLIHQVPSLKICPTHETLLLETSVPFTPFKQGYVTAELALKDVPIQLQDPFNDPEASTLLGIARNAARLLNHC